MSRPSRLGQLLFLLLALALGWWLARWTRFEERLTARFSTEDATLELNGRTYRAPAKAGHVHRLRVLTSETFEQLGGGSIVVRVPGQPEVEHPLPARWKFTGKGRPAPAGDWWVDRSHESEPLLSVDVDLRPPFEVTFTMPGRVLQAFRLCLDGEQPMDIGLRSGLLNNDLYLARPQENQSNTWMIGGPASLDYRRSLGPLAKGLFLGAALCLGFSLLAGFGRGAPPGAGWITPRVASVFTWLLLLVRFGFSCYIATAIFGALPTFQDDLCYYLRANWLLHGQLDLPVPPAGDQLLPPFNAYIKDRWLTAYPLNWSILLAAGLAFGAAWVVSPICSAIALWAQFQFSRSLGGDRVGLLSALLLATSPFCLLFAGSMMNHAATSMLLGLFVLGFIKGWPEGQGPRLGILVAAGAALGFTFGIRPLTSVAIGVPTLLLGLWEWRLRRFSGRAFLGLVCFALGVGLGMSTTFLDNAAVTGNPLVFGYHYRVPMASLSSRLPLAAFWSDRSMAQLPYLMTGWGWPWLRDGWWLCLPYGLAVVPFLLRRAGRHEWFAGGIFLAVVAAHYTHEHGTIHGFGPRIYIDALFALFFLVARGWQCLAHASPLPGTGPGGPWAWRVAAVVALSLPLSSAIKLPERIQRYRGYNEVDRKFLNQFAALGAPRGLFLFEHDALLKWIRAAPLLPLFPPESPYVFAASARDGDNTAVIARYGQDRPVYLVTEFGIQPYQPKPKPPSPP